MTYCVCACCRGQRTVFHNFKTSNKESTSNQAQCVLNKGLKKKKKKSCDCCLWWVSASYVSETRMDLLTCACGYCSTKCYKSKVVDENKALLEAPESSNPSITGIARAVETGGLACIWIFTLSLCPERICMAMLSFTKKTNWRKMKFPSNTK